MTDKSYIVIEFEDGLQVVPSNWLNKDRTKSVWPNFTNNSKYDKAVRSMQEPEPTWMEHSIRKIYGIYSNFSVAKQKLKQAEELSDLTSNTENEFYWKKSRKIRAAKAINSDESTSSNDDLSDEFISQLPKIYKVSKKAKIEQKSKKDFNNKTVNYSQNLSLSGTTGTTAPNYAQEMHGKNVAYSQSIEENAQNVQQWFSIDEINNSVVIAEPEHQTTLHLDNDSNVLYEKKDLNVEQRVNNEIVGSVPMFEKTTVLNNEQKLENFQRFVVRKLIDLEMKMNNTNEQLKMIKKHQKLILEKVSIGVFETEEKENIDIMQDLPLKDQNSLDNIEERLKTDTSYRNEMMKQLIRVTCTTVKTSCLRLMKLILSNEIATNYSWFGAKKKQNFSRLEICKIIMNVIRKSHGDVKDEEISAPIKIWLAHAKERLEREQNNTRFTGDI